MISEGVFNPLGFSKHLKASSAFSSDQTRSFLVWLRTHILSNSLAHIPQLLALNPSLHSHKFDHGQSNPTYLITMFTQSDAFNLVLRAQPRGKLLPGAHRLDREYKVLTALQETAVPVPKPYAYCADRAVLGTEFYIMEYVSGQIFKDITMHDLGNPNDRAQVFREAIRVLIELHQVDVIAIGLATLSRLHPPWIDRQIDTWYRQYRASTVPGVNYEVMENLHSRLITERTRSRENVALSTSEAVSEKSVLVHGDFRVDNLIFQRRGKSLVCVAILDWELVSLGNPLADLASFLTPFHMPHEASKLEILRSIVLPDPLPSGIPREYDIIQHYFKNVGIGKDVQDNLPLYLSVALFKFAAIIYGVQARAFQGNAASPYAKQLGEQAHVFVHAAHSLLDRRHSSNTESQRAPYVHSAASSELLDKLHRFMENEMMPLEAKFLEHISGESKWMPWMPLETLKNKAKACGLWNLFLPKSMGGRLSSLEYSPLASKMGKCIYAAEAMNCSAPDTGTLSFVILLTKQGSTIFEPIRTLCLLNLYQ